MFGITLVMVDATIIIVCMGMAIWSFIDMWKE